MFIALDLPMTVRPDVKKEDWPGTYFVIQDRHYEMFGKNRLVAKKHEKKVEVVNDEVADDSPNDQSGDDDENVVENEVKKEENQT